MITLLRQNRKKKANLVLVKELTDAEKDRIASPDLYRK